MKHPKNKYLIVILFALAMGFLEAIVVIYLRALYYPGGFEFPLVTIPLQHFNIEIVREIATLIMLVCVGMLAGKTKNEKFAWFLFAFGFWDIFYYVGLKLALDWPTSLSTWDILFLIPVTWIGPVLAPLICSVTMILLALLIFSFERKGYKKAFGKYTWTLFIFGSVIIIVSFIESYFLLLWFEGFFNIFSNDYSQLKLDHTIAGFIPSKFNWLLFSIGEFFILGGIFHLFRNYVKQGMARKRWEK